MGLILAQLHISSSAKVIVSNHQNVRLAFGLGLLSSTSTRLPADLAVVPEL